MPDDAMDRVTGAMEAVTPKYVIVAGIILFAAGLGWVSVEYLRHGQIHAVSAVFTGSMIFLGLSLFAGMERVSGALRAIAVAIREARGKS